VNTAQQVGDVDHFKVFATADAAQAWFEQILMATPSNTT